MKLAFCIFRYFPYSGLSRVFLSIVDEMARRGHKIDVFVYEWQGERPDNVNIKLLPTGKWTNHNRDATYYKTVKPFLAAGNYQAVIGFNKMPELDFYYAGDFCYIDRISSKYRDVYRLTPRHHHFAKFEKEVFGVHSNTVLLMLSEREKQIYQDNYATDDSRFVILPPALDRRNIITDNTHQVRQAKRTELCLSDAHILILFVGSGFKTKGLDRAIQALSDLPETLKSIATLLVVGQDNELPYKQKASRLGVQDSVMFSGGRFDVPELMQAADLLLHPAYREAGGNVLLEAIASGLPVLTTDSCGYAPHVRKAQAGCVIKSPVTQDSINTTLATMLQSDRRHSWSVNGRAYGQHQQLYHMPVFAADIIEQKTPAIARAKSRQTATFVVNRTTRSFTTYRSDIESSQVKQLFKNPDAFLKEHATRIIKHDQTTTVAVIECDGQMFVLKRYNTKGVWHFFKRSVRITRASTCWHFAHRLLQFGLHTPLPIGYKENRFGQLRGRSYYLAQHSTGETLDEFLQGRLDNERLQLVAELMNDFFRIMKVQKLAHGDLKASNFLINKDRLEVLDLDSMRSYQLGGFHRHKLFRDKRRFLRNWVEQPEIYNFFKQSILSDNEQNILAQASPHVIMQD